MEAPPRDFLVSFSPILWIIYSETCPLPLICPDEGCLEEPKEAFIYEFAWGNNPQENKTIYSKIGCNKLHYGTILDKTSTIKCKSSEYNIVHGMEKKQRLVQSSWIQCNTAGGYKRRQKCLALCTCLGQVKQTHVSSDGGCQSTIKTDDMNHMYRCKINAVSHARSPRKQGEGSIL